MSVLSPATAEPLRQDLPAPILVDSPVRFGRMLAELRAEPALGVDTESNSFYRYFYRVCLIQISTCQADYIVDPLQLPDLAPLGDIFADPAIEKVFHAAENDVLMMKRDYGFRFASLFDTMLAARILGWRQVSLAALLKQHFGVGLDKRAQLTDWGQRPLTSAQLSYARLDSRHLLPLRDLLIGELKDRKRWREAQEAFMLLSELTYVEKPFDPSGFWRMRDARKLDNRELAVLRELYVWRDEQARALDRPPFKVMGDELLIHLSRAQPRRRSDLPLSPRQDDLYGVSLLEAVERGRRALPPEPPARPRRDDGRPDARVSARFERLRAWRSACAAERGVDADIVLSNQSLMKIARAAPESIEALASLEVMGPSKLEEYGAGLLTVLADVGRDGGAG